MTVDTRDLQYLRHRIDPAAAAVDAGDEPFEDRNHSGNGDPTLHPDLGRCSSGITIGRVSNIMPDARVECPVPKLVEDVRALHVDHAMPVTSAGQGTIAGSDRDHAP